MPPSDRIQKVQEFKLQHCCYGFSIQPVLFVKVIDSNFQIEQQKRDFFKVELISLSIKKVVIICEKVIQKEQKSNILS